MASSSRETQDGDVVGQGEHVREVLVPEIDQPRVEVEVVVPRVQLLILSTVPPSGPDFLTSIPPLG
mgnify:CR=1 FL=1